jgi:hypothetical protein
MNPKASATRKADGWAPTLDYPNGGRVIAALRCGTLDEALLESLAMIDCMEDHPGAFVNNHPEPNQLIDLTK